MTKKNPHAVALGRRGGKKGGKARAEKLSKEERSAIAKKAAEARWRDKPAKTAYEGVIHIGDMKIDCAVLEDGRRVISEAAVMRALGRTYSGYYSKRDADSTTAVLPRYLAPIKLKPYISEDLASLLSERIVYKNPSGSGRAHGVPATALPQICDVWLKARDAGVLTPRQKKTAIQADILMRGLAHVGIIALVDEATGYQYERDRNALTEILEMFIAKELAQWAKTFPEEFYEHLYRLHPNLDSEKLANLKPVFVGKLTSNIIYERLAPGIREELNRKNPRNAAGNRPHKHHQWLTRQKGYPRLMYHLGRVISIMEESKTWEEFKTTLDKRLPRLEKIPKDSSEAPQDPPPKITKEEEAILQEETSQELTLPFGIR